MKPYLNVLSHLLMGVLVLPCCSTNEEPLPAEPPRPSPTPTMTIREQLLTNYTPLPEKLMAISSDSSTYAQYAGPTDRYPHGILGDQLEASQLVVVVDSQFYQLTLSADYVFEDLQPRLFDVNHNGTLEIITIRSHRNKGAGIAIYEIHDQRIQEYAAIEEIGTPNRWLNPVAIFDLNDDEMVDIAWIQTPHIGGRLKVATVTPGQITPIDEVGTYSNHAIGSRNLCLSILTEIDGQKTVFVPTQNRSQVQAFTFNGEQWSKGTSRSTPVDFDTPLHQQLTETSPNLIDDQCIYLTQ